MMDELVGAFNQEMDITWEKTDGSFAALVKSVNLCWGREGSRGGRGAALLLTELERRHVCSGDLK